MRIKQLVASIVPILLLTLCAWLPGCLRAEESPEHWKDRGNRFEGTREVPNAASFFELVGLYAYRQRIGLTDAAQLHIRFFCPQGQSPEIDVREIRDEFHYHMQPKPGYLERKADGWVDFDGWPAKEVLTPLQLPLENLAVHIKLSDNVVLPVVAPALLFVNYLPPTVENYTVVGMVHRKVNDLQVRLQGTRRGGPLNSECRLESDRTVEADEAFSAVCAADQLSDGQSVIQISGSFTDGGDSLSASYSFYAKKATR
jgi:hypothetical protein